MYGQHSVNGGKGSAGNRVLYLLGKSLITVFRKYGIQFLPSVIMWSLAYYQKTETSDERTENVKLQDGGDQSKRAISRPGKDDISQAVWQVTPSC